MNQKKNPSYHSSKSRLQLGAIVYASIGPQVSTLLASGKRSSAKEKLYGQILESIQNNMYVVLFSDGKKREMKSQSLRKANSEQAEAYNKGLKMLMPTTTSKETSTNETNSIASDLDDNEADPFRLSTLMNRGQDLNQNNNIFVSGPDNNQDNQVDDMTFRCLDNLPFTTTNSTANKNKQTTIKTPKTSKSKNLTPTSNHSSTNEKKNTAKVIENVYEKQLRDAEDKLDELCKEGTTYTQRNGKGESVRWTMIPEHADLQPIPVRPEESLGIHDPVIKQQIANSALPTADLYLRLVYRSGNWRGALERMNRKINLHNEAQARTSSSSNRRSIHDFTEKEFLIGNAIVVGASDCSEKGENLWENSRSNRQWKKHWVSVSSPTNFGQYMRYYRFKQFKQFFPLIWQESSQPVVVDNNNSWWKFEPAIRTFNDNRRELITPSSIIAIDESMSAFRPQTTKTGRLPNISYILRKPENLGTEFKSTGK